MRQMSASIRLITLCVATLLSSAGIMVASAHRREQSRTASRPVELSESFPISPSVFATLATKDGIGELLALWRGSPGWYLKRQGPTGASYSRSSGQFSASIQQGGRDLNLVVDQPTSLARVGGKTLKIRPGGNVILIDGVDEGDGMQFRLASEKVDFTAAEIRPGGMGLNAILATAPAVAAFLRCDVGLADEHANRQLGRIGCQH